MKYKQLLEQLSTLNKEQLEMDVTVYDYGTDEYFAADDFVFTSDRCDVLDENHPVMIFGKFE